jgi:hypothetical protein
MKWNNKKRQTASGRFASFFGIIALVAVIGFSMAAWENEPEADPITITITGIPGSEYSGWEANLAIDNDDNMAWAMPLNVTASTASLTFTMLRMDNNKEFNTPGTYMIVFWFEKSDEEDVDDVNYVIVSKSINGGSNTIAFDSFSKLKS